MKITIAKTAGFCMGVRRAVELSLDASNASKEPICTYGPLIHNPQVLHLLHEKGMEIIDTIPGTGEGTVLLRAHGVPPETKAGLARAGFNIIDATCPRVIRVQTIIRKHAAKGYATIIIGDEDHPEVVGLLGYAGDNGFVVDSLEGLQRLPEFERAIIVAQTTQNSHSFKKIQKWTADHYPHYKIYNTICDSTEKRQAEVAQLARSVDAMIVVGGHDSGNTQRLAEVAKETGTPAYHIESEEDIDPDEIAAYESVGITAGASTPNWIITKVHRRLETLTLEKKHSWRRFVFPLQRLLIFTNLYVATGAGCLAFASSLLQGLGNHRSPILIAFLYVLSMHTFNHLTGRKSDRYNDPERAEFYEANRTLLYGLAIGAGAAGLGVAVTLGILPFAVLLTMIVFGALYNVKLIPEGLLATKWRAVKDVPGSKTVLIGIAWGIVTTVLPALALADGFSPMTVIVFLWAAGMVFARTVFFDIVDIQGDRIVGQATIPILIGEKRTQRLLMSVTFGVVLLMLAATAVSGRLLLGLPLGLASVLLPVVIAAHQRGKLLSGTRLSFLVESVFILVGVVAGMAYKMGFV